MSRASKLTLLGTSLFALGTVVFVHYQQKAEQEAMHQGVIRDMEQQRLKRERQADFDQQRALEAEYKREQTVRDGSSSSSSSGLGRVTQTAPPT
ncbi:hypothetical protein N657DRAFT_650050 [Parathielavia appendiculata]|uniref:Cytochrome c oxidase assembly protein n=1 Tax=Parathielavia appendiculata TaxID=2587402 RepID=A0AAN6YZ70_9PEZI|nr:hypothetical protein N657DRAFT_650050 [Parathielavia appendiculata]